MKKTLSSFTTALKILTSDKLVISFSLLPIAVGIGLYLLVGDYFYDSLLGKGQKFITDNISSSDLGTFIYYVMFAIMTVGLFFVISWTFVLVVSIIASPFNDIISQRTEKIVRGIEPSSLKETFTQMIKNFFATIWNEVKKVCLILTLTLFGFIASLMFPPIGVLISSLLLAVQFIDYSWSRHDLSVGGCISNTKSNIFSYTAAGFGFTMLFAIPIVNLIAYPLATVYFTTLFTNKSSKLLVELEVKEIENSN